MMILERKQLNLDASFFGFSTFRRLMAGERIFEDLKKENAGTLCRFLIKREEV